MPTTSHTFLQYFQNEIRRRYSSSDSEMKWLGFSGEDYRLPRFILNDGYGRTSEFYAPNAINFLSVPSESSVMHFSKMCNECGIDRDKVRQNLAMINDKHAGMTKIIIVGYGGFMINMIHFINKLMRLTFDDSAMHLFQMGFFYENDDLSLTNLPRIFKDVNESDIQRKFNHNNRNKLNLLGQDHIIFRRHDLNRSYLDSYRMSNIKRYEIGEHATNNQTLFIGSPDFNTREMLKSEDVNFMFFGHSNDESRIVLNPSTDTDMTTETYGTINVSSFFVNVLKCTEKFIEIMAHNTIKEIRDMGHNTVLFETDIKKIAAEREENARSKTKRRSQRDTEGVSTW